MKAFVFIFIFILYIFQSSNLVQSQNIGPRPKCTPQESTYFSDCLHCDEGKFVNVTLDITNQSYSRQCTPCSAGHYCSSTTSPPFTELPCPAGQYQDQTGQNICKICEQAQSTDLIGLSFCPSKNFSLSVRSKREDALCPKGYYILPPPGQTCGNKCQRSKGHACDISCSSNRDNQVCRVECPPYDGHTCAICPKGHECHDGFYGPVKKSCGSETYQPSEGKSFCPYCRDSDAEDTTTNGQTECPRCKGTRYDMKNELNVRNTYCQHCPPGYYKTQFSVGDPEKNGEPACAKCPVGHTCYKGVKTPCRPGQFQDEVGIFRCKECGLYGSIGLKSGQKECSRCARCKMYEDLRFPHLRNTRCEHCPDGWYKTQWRYGDADNWGRPACEPCPVHHYCPREKEYPHVNRAVKLPCPEGTHQCDTGQTSCDNTTSNFDGCKEEKWVPYAGSRDLSPPVIVEKEVFYILDAADDNSTDTNSTETDECAAWNVPEESLTTKAPNKACIPAKDSWLFKTVPNSNRVEHGEQVHAKCGSAWRDSPWQTFECNNGEFNMEDAGTACPKLCSRKPKLIGNGHFDFIDGFYETYRGQAKSGSTALTRCDAGFKLDVDLPLCGPNGEWDPPTVHCSIIEDASSVIPDAEIDPCEEGYYRTSGQRTGPCTICPRGHQCSQGAKKPCPAGLYQFFEGKSSCEICYPMAASVNVEGQIQCDKCADEMAYDSKNEDGIRNTICLNCPKGYYRTSEPIGDPEKNGSPACATCPVGHQCTNGKKEACTGSDYQDEEEQSVCKSCISTGAQPLNTANAQTKCATCADPQYDMVNKFNTRDTYCESCPSGYYRTSQAVGDPESNGEPACAQCPGGDTCSEDCDEGYYRSNELKTGPCLVCPRGHRCTQGVKEPCPAGLYQFFEGKSSCEICYPMAESVNIEGQIECDKCADEMTYDSQNEAGIRNTICRECPEGYYRTEKPIGDPTSNGAPACAICPVGYQCYKAKKAACIGSNYQDEEGQSHCKNCISTGAEPLMSSDAQTKCAKCPDPLYDMVNTLNTRDTYCESCPPGYYRTSEPIGDSRNNGEPACCPDGDTCPKPGISTEEKEEQTTTQSNKSTPDEKSVETTTESNNVCFPRKLGWMFKEKIELKDGDKVKVKCVSARDRSPWETYKCENGQLDVPESEDHCPKLCPSFPEITNGVFLPFKGQYFSGGGAYETFGGKPKIGSQVIAKCKDGYWPELTNKIDVVRAVCANEGLWQPPKIDCVYNFKKNAIICTKDTAMCIASSMLSTVTAGTVVGPIVVAALDAGVGVVDYIFEQRFDVPLTSWIALKVTGNRIKRENGYQRPRLLVNGPLPNAQNDPLKPFKRLYKFPFTGADRSKIMTAQRAINNAGDKVGPLPNNSPIHKPDIDFSNSVSGDGLTKAQARSRNIASGINTANALFNLYNIAEEGVPSTPRELIQKGLEVGVNGKQIVDEAKRARNLLKKTGDVKKLAKAGTALSKTVAKVFKVVPFACLAVVALSPACANMVKKDFDDIVQQQIEKAIGKANRNRRAISPVDALRSFYAPLEHFIVDNPEFSLWFTIQDNECRSAFGELVASKTAMDVTDETINESLLTKSSCENLAEVSKYRVVDMYRSFMNYTSDSSNEYSKLVAQAREAAATITDDDIEPAVFQMISEEIQTRNQYLKNMKPVIGWTSIGNFTDIEDVNQAMLVVYEAGPYDADKDLTVLTADNTTTTGSIYLQVQLLLHVDCVAELIWNAAMTESMIKLSPAPLIIKQKLSEDDLLAAANKTILEDFRLWYIVDYVADDQKPPVYMIKLDYFCQYLYPGSY